MTSDLKNIIDIGETSAVEFKLCSDGISPDTYKTVCSFLNRYGGDIYLGIDDNGVVVGVPHNAAEDIKKNFIKMVSNPEVISPTIYLVPEIIKHRGKQVIHIHVPPSSEVHSCKKTIYDRVDDSDVKVTATGQIAAMFIRKQKIYTEKSVYPYVKDEDLRIDLLSRVRQMAVNRYEHHPWENMSDTEIIKSAGLIGTDMETNKKGYNLAAIMLLGRDEVILDVCPAYRTDAIVRKVNINRYDDRVIVNTNLIESYDVLMGFAEKNLWDKFYLEKDARISLRNAIAREILINCLMHREMSSSYTAKFIIEKDRMYTENANRATTGGVVTLENFAPDTKNPIIGSFFRNIGLADELGSGVKNLYHYVPLYSGKPPELIDGDVFRTIVPLDDEYSFDMVIIKGAGIKDDNVDRVKDLEKDRVKDLVKDQVNETQYRIIELLLENPQLKTAEISAKIGINDRNVRKNIKSLKDAGLIKRIGSDKVGHWEPVI